MEKECEYCGSEFEAKRSDAKYCSATCKQEAYLTRKANPGIVNRQQTSTNTDHNKSNIGQVVNSDITLSKTELNRLLRGTGTNQDVLHNLLNEKDITGDIKSDKAKLEINLMFIERDLKTATDENARLKAENERLLSQVEKSTDLSSKFFDFIKDNPQFGFVIANLCEGVMDKVGLKPKKVSNNSTSSAAS